MIAEPPVIGSLMTDSDSTWSSTTIANGFPIFSCVMVAKRRAPRAFKRNDAIGCWVRGSIKGDASMISSPSIAISFRTTEGSLVLKW